MTDAEKAAKVIAALKAAEREPAQQALPILNGLVGLVQGDPDQPLERRGGAVRRVHGDLRNRQGAASRPARRSAVGAGDRGGAAVDGRWRASAEPAIRTSARRERELCPEPDSAQEHSVIPAVECCNPQEVSMNKVAISLALGAAHRSPRRPRRLRCQMVSRLCPTTASKTSAWSVTRMGVAGGSVASAAWSCRIPYNYYAPRERYIERRGYYDGGYYNSGPSVGIGVGPGGVGIGFGAGPRW